MITAEAALNMVLEYSKEPGVNQSDIIQKVGEILDRITESKKCNVNLIIMYDFDEAPTVNIPSSCMIIYTCRHLSMIRIFNNYNVKNVYITRKAIEQNEEINLIIRKLQLDGKDYQTIG